MPLVSAGILVYRKNPTLEVFLVHPGGPYWTKKDDGIWSIPKGQVDENEERLTAAKREFTEETGFAVPPGNLLNLGSAEYVSKNKKVHAWAVKGDLDASAIKSMMLTIEWPPRTGKQLKFPECDKAGWFTIPTALQKIVKGQAPLLERLAVEVGN
ncbi:MAG TPA: NUDIX domain-containing protein [Candidatus Saccharimonas sp.]|nr:NUDIX domain-containing protein [Candidatus Saccharimonas sp.]